MSTKSSFAAISLAALLSFVACGRSDKTTSEDRKASSNDRAPVANKAPEPNGTTKVASNEKTPITAAKETKKPVDTPQIVEPMREWKSDDGKFSTQAKLIEVVDEGKKIRLEKVSGKLATVPIGRLSPSDQEYLRERGRSNATKRRDALEPAQDSYEQMLRKGRENVARGGEHWSVPDKVRMMFDDKVVTGDRFYIWPVEDKVYVASGGNVIARFHWVLRSGKPAPGDAEQDPIRGIFSVNSSGGGRSGFSIGACPLKFQKDDKYGIFEIPISLKDVSGEGIVPIFLSSERFGENAMSNPLAVKVSAQ